MIPGFLIVWATFPGVIVHELAHAFFCLVFKQKIYEVKYFTFSMRMGQPAGYVVHERAQNPWQDVMIAIAPFLVNTIVGAVIAVPAVIPVLTFHSGDFVDYFLIWLGVSIAMHSFPSTGDAKSIWHTVTAKDTPVATKFWAMPIVGLIYIGALGSIFWLDLFYGLFVVGGFSWLLIKLTGG